MHVLDYHSQGIDALLEKVFQTFRIKFVSPASVVIQVLPERGAHPAGKVDEAWPVRTSGPVESPEVGVPIHLQLFFQVGSRLRSVTVETAVTVVLGHQQTGLGSGQRIPIRFHLGCRQGYDS